MKKPRLGGAFKWWRGGDLNSRPSGYEPDELPDCSTPRLLPNLTSQSYLIATLVSFPGSGVRR